MSDDVGAHIEALLDRLRVDFGEAAHSAGEEIVELLVDYYGDGLSRVVGIVGDRQPQLLRTLAADPVIEGQLVLHGLHPVGLDERIEAALDRVRPYLGSHAGGVTYLGTGADAVARLRLDGNCSGCPSSTITVRTTIEQALYAAAPDLTGIEVTEAAAPPPLLQIGRARP